MLFKYKPDGQILKNFMKDNSFFRGIRGPVGSGKSVACCIEVFRRALAQKKSPDGIRKSRVAIVRNTNPQLRTTTMKTWLDWFPEKSSIDKIVASAVKWYNMTHKKEIQ